MGCPPGSAAVPRIGGVPRWSPEGDPNKAPGGAQRNPGCPTRGTRGGRDALFTRHSPLATHHSPLTTTHERLLLGVEEVRIQLRQAHGGDMAVAEEGVEG